MKRLICIPARRAATRLPDKPLADIGGKPMIVRVWERAMAADCGPVIVACDDTDIADVIMKEGGTALMTSPNHVSGSDRIWEAVQQYDSDNDYDVIINVQGDLPTLEPHLIPDVLLPLENERVDITTLVAEITDEAEKTSPSVVKPILSFYNDTCARALYFTRATAPTGEGALYHHIGMYAYRRSALEKFVSLSPSPLELREKLEQLRALEAGMRIDATVVDTVPLGVDTPTDLEKARKYYEA